MIAGLMACLLTAAANADGLVLVDAGESDYRIVVADDASESTRHAADELRHFLAEISGMALPIGPTSDGPAIRVGTGACPGIDVDDLGSEGYTIRTAGEDLLIAGGEPRGTLYGVYCFLQDELGCRWFTPDVSRIPKCDRVVVRPIDRTYIPPLEYRAPDAMDTCMDPDWCARNQVNNQCLRWLGRPGAPADPGRLGEKHGATQWWGGGLGVHTFFRLLPPAEHFDAHPEYYSLIDGERRWQGAQLCCTNGDVLRLVTEATLARIADDPDGRYYSVSQEDWYGYCQCEPCQALAADEGTQAAPVLALVNHVAEAVEERYPDKVITTLAYQWTRTPPRRMRARSNVMVRLCTIECDFGHGIAKSTHPSNVRFRDEIAGWARQSERLFIWNYTTNFSNYYAPHPTLRALDDDIRFFIAHNVRGIYEQDTQMTLHADMTPLGGYLMAQLLWEPNYGEDRAIDEFVAGVYGPAAPFVRAYVDLLHDKIEADGIYVHCFGGTQPAFLTPEVLGRADELWDAAEAAARTDVRVLRRVQTARLSHDFAMLEHLRATSRFAFDHEAFTIDVDRDFLRRAERFATIGRRAGAMQMNEGGYPFTDYCRGLLADVSAADLPVQLTPHEPVAAGARRAGLRYEYFSGSFDKLPDFDALSADGGGVAASITLDVEKPDVDYAIRYRGFIEVLRPGIYAFWSHSDDGSRVTIGDEIVVDNDGGGTKTGHGTVALRAGLHPIIVTYYMGKTLNLLEVSYAGPGFDRQSISEGVLSHAAR